MPSRTLLTLLLAAAVMASAARHQAMHPAKPVASDPATGLDLGAAQEVAAQLAMASQQGGNVLTQLGRLHALEPVFTARPEGLRQVLQLELMRLSAEVGDIAAAHRYADLIYGGGRQAAPPPISPADLKGLVLAGYAERQRARRSPCPPLR